MILSAARFLFMMRHENHHNDTQIKTLDEVRRFLEGTGAVDLAIEAREERYVWIQQTLIRFGYRRLGKADIHAASEPQPE